MPNSILPQSQDILVLFDMISSSLAILKSAICFVNAIDSCSLWRRTRSDQKEKIANWNLFKIYKPPLNSCIRILQSVSGCPGYSNCDCIYQIDHNRNGIVQMREWTYIWRDLFLLYRRAGRYYVWKLLERHRFSRLL